MSALNRFATAVLAISLAGCGQQLVEFPDTPPVPSVPAITLVTPANTTSGVSSDTTVTAVFSEAMDPATLNASTFTLTLGSSSVAGSVSAVGTTATFTPASALEVGTFTATVTLGAKSQAGGTSLAAQYTWTFSTPALPLPPPPQIVLTDPLAGAVGVPVVTHVTVAFNQAMDPSSLTPTTFVLTLAETAVTGTVSYSNSLATFIPQLPLLPGALYTATVTTGAKSSAGVAIAANDTWSFTTRPVPVNVPPVVLVTNPLDLATGVDPTVHVTAAFSQQMDLLTITGATFTLKQGANSVPGTVSYAGSVATFAAASPLTAGTVYTATVTTGAKNTGGLALAANDVWSFTTVLATPPPTVVAVNPLDLASGVALNQQVTATFSRPMNSATLTPLTFTLSQGGNGVPGTVTYSGSTATFAPSSLLLANTLYSATITTGAKDPAGIALAASDVWSFTTVLATPSPTVVATNPRNLDNGVDTGVIVTAAFSQAMDALTITPVTFLLKQGLNPVPGNVTYAASVATFTPASPLTAGTAYTATVTTGAKNTGGLALVADKVWTFTTALGTLPPTVIITNPVDQASGVALNQQVTATFSRPMDSTTITPLTFTLNEGVTPVPGKVTYLGSTATFAPTNPLVANTTYSATISTGAKDPAGIALAADFRWRFMTQGGLPPGLGINLGAAATFGLASQAGLTSTGVTVVNGDVALYPNFTCTDATGGPGLAAQTCLVKTYASTTGMTVNGSIYWAGDPFDSGATANQVTIDLNTAWVQGKNKVDTLGAIAAGEMGGQTFLPGVYHNASLGLMAGGIATLDAQGDPNAEFYFKVDSSFVDSGTLRLPSSIVLRNGAQARNVWFILGLDGTIGSGTTWNGNILAGRTLKVLDGSSVLGRVLAGASGAGALTLTGAASPSLTSITVPQ